ncbi:C40 family peptidase [Streptobacillus moniliformis]|uniref:NLP/P60 protein n=1 Tax=Streptobacillus moniliformis (strain ATCC 14647 / DSM 12112 / NCTC 10651 / 9901) TaxID=519441 RepID=D1AYV3_STRM9|nr:NlpC/P60 family protein [Streptobacillus moniliformis]ACZ01479.1 NLP/P60 protein [Streptobacillus moniliformis DSM 12112]SQA13360.1 Probable endopeptidase Spr precursor [Streptobacillus moniliformis]
MLRYKKMMLVLSLALLPAMGFSANKISLKKSSTKSQRELVMQDSNSIVFDSEYIHDQSYIDKKINEIEESVMSMSGVYNSLDNIILKNKLFSAYDKWAGTKYIFGGVNHKGIDCSALTREVFRDVFGYELPRVSVDQVKKGRKIEKGEMKPGDLLYFRPENRVNHVAVYIGNSLFINASSSKGVVLSSLNNSYWGKYFKYAVRVDAAREVR